ATVQVGLHSFQCRDGGAAAQPRHVQVHQGGADLGSVGMEHLDRLGPGGGGKGGEAQGTHHGAQEQADVLVVIDNEYAAGHRRRGGVVHMLLPGRAGLVGRQGGSRRDTGSGGGGVSAGVSLLGRIACTAFV